MKKTVNVAIGGCSFIIDEDAYIALDNYLDRFRTAMNDSAGSDDVMEELEGRIADLMKLKLVSREVVNLKIVEEIIAQIGYPEGYNEGKGTINEENMNAPRKFFRDSEDKKIAGVCSGLALYLGIDVVFVRIIFLVALICGTAGFWAYIIFWVVAPETRTAVEKCELRGLPPTAENIRRFTTNQ
ncbi:MAG: PspC domain-containing protein [Bacteroidales bacterium]|nr:PspC domain-containing protein [Bacteroidales bacterium]